MKTSYYQNKALDAKKYLVVQTSIGAPRFGTMPEWYMETMMPPEAILGLQVTPYTEAYIAHLEKQGVEQFKNEFVELEAEAAKTGREVVLCCFESLKKEGQFCHRRIFADWWLRQTGEVIPELTP